jgi:hypothetical protein
VPLEFSRLKEDGADEVKRTIWNLFTCWDDQVKADHGDVPSSSDLQTHDTGFFVTSLGYIGVAPDVARIGDEIVVVEEISWYADQTLLRKVKGQEAYTFDGFVHIHGIEKRNSDEVVEREYVLR